MKNTVLWLDSRSESVTLLVSIGTTYLPVPPSLQRMHTCLHIVGMIMDQEE